MDVWGNEAPVNIYGNTGPGNKQWLLVKFSVALYVDLKYPWETCLSLKNPETITYYPQESEVFTGDWDNQTVSWN